MSDDNSIDQPRDAAALHASIAERLDSMSAALDALEAALLAGNTPPARPKPRLVVHNDQETRND
nr:hypothetical protein [uncultured Lichenicoccus sp.]